MKVVINACYGGFSLSRRAFLQLREMGNASALSETDYGEKYPDGSGPRTTSAIEGCGCFLVERLGVESHGEMATLKTIEIPDDVEWDVEEYDGQEWIAEKHRRWE